MVEKVSFIFAGRRAECSRSLMCWMFLMFFLTFPPRLSCYAFKLPVHTLDGTRWAFLSFFCYSSLLWATFHITPLAGTLLTFYVNKRCVARTPLDAIHAKKNQVFAAATLPRKPGLQQILASIRLYRKECAAGLVRVSPSHAVKAACLQSLQWDDEIVSCMCSCGTRFWKPMQGWRLKNQQTPSVFSLFGATARHRVCAYVYIYIYVVAVFFHQLDQGFLFLKMFEKTFKFFDYIDTKGS